MRNVLLIGLLSLPLSAALVTDAALGSSLAGATVTVTRFGEVLSGATFVAAGLGATASSPGSAGFLLTVTPGDTSTATWTLTNTDSSSILLNRITAVTIDLTLAGLALFDSGTLPSTPDSGPGVPGVLYVGGVIITGVTDLLPWGDPANTGDMFRALRIEFGGGFTAGASSSWTDDTDGIAIREPSSLGCLGLVLVVCSVWPGRWRYRPGQSPA